MRFKLFWLAFATVALFLFIPAISAHTITVPTNANFGIPSYGTYLSFSTQQTFDSVRRSGNTWIFDEYQFSVENGNLTVNNLFSTPDTLNVSVYALQDTESTVQIDASDAGYTHPPQSVTPTGETSNWGHTFTDNLLTITADHSESGSVVYDINWAEAADGAPSGGTGGPAPSPEEPEEPEPSAPDEPLITPPDVIVTPEVHPLLVFVGVVAVGLVAYGVSQKRKRYIEWKKGKGKKPEWKKPSLWD